MTAPRDHADLSIKLIEHEAVPKFGNYEIRGPDERETYMASVESIERTLDKIMSETAGGGGVKLNIEFIVYDNGLVQMDGRVLGESNGHVPGGSIDSWNASNEVFAMYMRLFARRVRKRCVNLTKAA